MSCKALTILSPNWLVGTYTVLETRLRIFLLIGGEGTNLRPNPKERPR